MSAVGRSCLKSVTNTMWGCQLVVALLGVALYTVPTTEGLPSRECSRQCAEECPQSCLVPLADPCHCCPFICAASEGESCGVHLPCQPDLACARTENGEVCSCREETGMVCGNNGVTYSSICQFKRETAESNITLDHQGPCNFPPEIASGPTDTKRGVGEPLALDCEVKGYPIPTVTWTFTSRDGHKKILPSDDEWTAVQLRGGPEHLMVTSWVQIIESRASDSGSYTCTAKNSLGSASAEAAVSIRSHHHRHTG